MAATAYRLVDREGHDTSGREAANPRFMRGRPQRRSSQRPNPPAGCWARKDVAVAVEQTTGRERLNIHGAINLETGQTQILAVEKVNALSFIKLLGEIEGTHTAMRLIHVFVDNASYHKAGVVKEWLAAAGRKIVLHFLPSYCPHLDPIERLWALMHENVTHNRDYKTFNEFRERSSNSSGIPCPNSGNGSATESRTISA